MIFFLIAVRPNIEVYVQRVLFTKYSVLGRFVYHVCCLFDTRVLPPLKNARPKEIFT